MVFEYLHLSTFFSALQNRQGALWLDSLQHGFVSTLPVVMLGVLALTVSQMLLWLAPQWHNSLAFNLTQSLELGVYGLMSVMLTLAVSHKLAGHYQKRFSLAFDPLQVALLAMMSLAAVLIMDHQQNGFAKMGIPSVAKGLLCAVFVTELFVFFFRFRPTRFTYLNDLVPSHLHQAIRSVWPALIAPLVFLLIYRMLFDAFGWAAAVMPWIMGEVDAEQGLSVWQSSKLILINQLSWFVGVHGSSIVEAYPEYLLPNRPDLVYSKQFVDVFAHIGGAGCTLGLVLALIVSRHRQHKRLGYYSLVPSLFNINELIIFGLPIIFNRYFLIPFLCVPILTSGLFRVAYELNWLSWQGDALIWSTPVVLGGYLATGQWQGALFQLVCVLVAFLAYQPFLVLYQKQQALEQSQAGQALLEELSTHKDMAPLLTDQTRLGRFARSLVQDLKQDLINDRFDVYYQPKVNDQQRVVGAEALFRWQHPQLGWVSPATLIPLAESHGLIHMLGQQVLTRSLRDLRLFHIAGMTQFKLAVNVSPLQLSHPRFIEQFQQRIERSGVDPKHVEIEITEGSEIELSDHVLSGLKKLSRSGISIAVDDFGMGYTSLRYLKSLPVNTLKIDGSIIKDVLVSLVVQDIVQSMTQLAKNMNVQVVAEWVETQDQFDKLVALGCDQLQGKIMSMPLPVNEFVRFCGLKGMS